MLPIGTCAGTITGATPISSCWRCSPASRSHACVKPAHNNSGILKRRKSENSAVRRCRQNATPATHGSAQTISPPRAPPISRPLLPWQTSRPALSHTDRSLPINLHMLPVTSAPRSVATEQLRPYRDSPSGTPFRRTIYREAQLNEISIEEMRQEDCAAALPHAVPVAPLSADQQALAAEAAAQSMPSLLTAPQLPIATQVRYNTRPSKPLCDSRETFLCVICIWVNLLMTQSCCQTIPHELRICQTRWCALSSTQTDR